MTLKANEIKKALDPHIKRASQTQVKKIRNTIKQNQMKNMPAKKDQEVKTKEGFDDLRDIVKIRKQKAVINELGELIYEQGEEKKKREGGKNVSTSRIVNPIEAVIANNPDKLKDMTLEEAKKLAMFTNKSGSNSNISDIKEVIIALNEIKKTNGGDGSLSDKVIGILLDKAFSNNNGGSQKVDSGNDKFMEFMMKQNLQNQEMLMKIMEDRNRPAPVENKNDKLIEKLFDTVKTQGDMENSFLREKLRDMETRIQPTDTLGEASRMFEFLKTFKGILGGSPQTEASMTHELKTKQMDFDQTHQIKEENLQTERMNSIGDMVNNAIETFGKILGEPIAEAAKTKIEQFTESAKHPTEKKEKRPSTNVLRKEIDLGNLEELEDDLAEMENIPEKRKSRFRVAESGK